MASRVNFLGGFVSELINIKKFKESNSYSTQPLKLSEITKRPVIEVLDPMEVYFDFSKSANKILERTDKGEKRMYEDEFASSDTLGSQNDLPSYDSGSSKLQTLDTVKSDLGQAKRTRMHSPPPSLTPKGETVTDQTLLITVTIYPRNFWRKSQVCNLSLRLHHKDSIQFHDGQTLEDVKRAFLNQDTDTKINDDDIHYPQQLYGCFGYKKPDDSLFYINDNIYADCKPYKMKMSPSKEKWPEDDKSTIVNVLSMNTKLIDLEIRIGELYVFQHSKRCEHLFAFNEISFAQPNSSLGFDSYPKTISSISKEKCPKGCYRNKSLLSIGSKTYRTPTEVDKLCESCFMIYHYDNIENKNACFKSYWSKGNN